MPMVIKSGGMWPHVAHRAKRDLLHQHAEDPARSIPISKAKGQGRIPKRQGKYPIKRPTCTPHVAKVTRSCAEDDDATDGYQEHRDSPGSAH